MSFARSATRTLSVMANIARDAVIWAGNTSEGCEKHVRRAEFVLSAVEIRRAKAWITARLVQLIALPLPLKEGRGWTRFLCAFFVVLIRREMGIRAVGNVRKRLIPDMEKKQEMCYRVVKKMDFDNYHLTKHFHFIILQLWGKTKGSII